MGCVFWVQLRVFLIDLHFCMGFNIFRGMHAAMICGT